MSVTSNIKLTFQTGYVKPLGCHLLSEINQKARKKGNKMEISFYNNKNLDTQIQNKGKKATEWNAPWTKVMEKRKKETRCSPLKSSGRKRN